MNSGVDVASANERKIRDLKDFFTERSEEAFSDSGICVHCALELN